MSGIMPLVRARYRRASSSIASTNRWLPLTGHPQGSGVAGDRRAGIGGIVQGMTAQRLRLVLEGVVFALAVAMAWVGATEGVGSTAFTILLLTAILSNLAMAIWALLARHVPVPQRPEPQPQIRLHLRDS